MKTIYIWILLMILTLAAIAANYFHLPSVFIIGFFSIKFLLVAFFFMELYKAHFFWKFSIIAFVLIINSIILFV